MPARFVVSIITIAVIGSGLSAMPSAIGPDAEIASSTVSTPCCPFCVGLLRQIAAIDGLMAAGHEG